MIVRDENGLVAKIGEDTVRVVDNSIIEVTIAGIKYENEGYQPGMCHGEFQMLEDALSFLQAAGEAVEYHERGKLNPFEVDEDGDRVNDGSQWLFEEEVSRWAAKNKDELAMLELEIVEGFRC